MMPAKSRDNVPWNLENFLDSMILELDKAQDTLAVKGVNRKVTYTVQDVALDLQIFPSFDGRQVRFVTAEPGQDGSSRMSIQLGSITDRQIRDNARPPVRAGDVNIDDLEEIDEDTKRSLQRIGVRSADDLERMEQHEVDVESALRRNDGKTAKTDYGRLASLIQRAKRGAPRVSSVSLDEHAGGHTLSLLGENLVLGPRQPGYPAARLNRQSLALAEGSADALQFALSRPEAIKAGSNQLEVALDPHTMISLSFEG